MYVNMFIMLIMLILSIMLIPILLMNCNLINYYNFINQRVFLKAALLKNLRISPEKIKFSEKLFTFE